MEQAKEDPCHQNSNWDGEWQKVGLLLVRFNHVDLHSKPGKQPWVEPHAVLDLALLVLQQPRKQRRRLSEVIRLYTDGSINLQINGLVKRVLE